MFDQVAADIARELAKWDWARGQDEFGGFRDHHEAKGTLFKNWVAAWRTWCRNGAKFDAERSRRPNAIISSTLRAIARTRNFEAVERLRAKRNGGIPVDGDGHFPGGEDDFAGDLQGR